jgi:two-component system chemotaxis sensor kinase CheA
MELSEYMPMFLAEAQEHLQELNLAVVRVEESPRDRSTIDKIFRIAHSFKGMSATMGFSGVAHLTHEMEDVFELLRQRDAGLTHEAVDTLLACLDTLSATLETIEATGAESLDPAPLVERLHSLVRPRTKDQKVARAGGQVVPDLAAAVADGTRVLHVVVDLDDEVLMPAVRAHMVLVELADHGELIGSIPAPETVEQFEASQVQAWLISDREDEAVAARLSAISEVARVQISEADANCAADQTVANEPATAAADAPQVTPPAAAPATPKSSGTRAAPSNTRTVRVDAERLDALMHAMGELVIHRTAVEGLCDDLDVPGLQHAIQGLTRSSQALQSMVMQVRMIPVDIVFLRFPRLVRDLSSKLDKRVKLDLVGSETELDRTVVDALGDPLVHLVRNSLDHGLESAQERAAAGKDPEGTLQISARHAGGSVVIEVRDDGRGVDAQAVARKALAAGLIDAQTAQEVDVKAAVELLFASGFSTAETTSDISGRGVGMDAVRAKIRELGGEVVVDSVPGVGTTAQIRLPLTLAIVSALLVEIGGDPYAIPLDRIERTLRVSEQAVQSIAGQRLLVVDDGVLPLRSGSSVFGRPTAEQHFAVIVRAGDRRVALAVDELIGQRELVTRPLPPMASGGEPVSGGAALPDGRIALIVDCDDLGTGTAASTLSVAEPSIAGEPQLAA